MASKKSQDAKPALDGLAAHAESIRKSLQVPKQNEVFRVAVEAGYLTAAADGNVDDEERAALVQAIDLLSEGAVIEWEAETLVEECAARAKAEGATKRAAAIGKELAGLGQVEAGLFFAALIAHASKGIDKREADILKAVGSAAGVPAKAVGEIVKKAAAVGE